MPNALRGKYLFLLGRLPEISWRELVALIGEEKLQRVTTELVAAEIADEEVAQKLLDDVGGSLKLMRVENDLTDATEEQILETVLEYLAKEGRPTFAMAEMGRDKFPKIEVTEIKKQLRNRDVSSRFIEGPRSGLSASVLLHQGVVELNIIRVAEEGQPVQTIIARTIGIQNIDEWTIRDRRKPYSNRKKGMLPPKLARMMVNFGLEQQDPKDIYVYDPFCGTGTVLLEALMRGCKVAGSDLDQEAVMGTQNNLNWFSKEYSARSDGRVFFCDATAVTLQHLGEAVDLIVTEPFLGKQTPKAEQLPNIFKGLEKLYLGTFKQWTKVLKQGGTVVIVFPYVEEGKQRFSLEGIIDKLEKFGYTSKFEPVLYHRPETTVQRQIWTFSYKKL